MPGTPTTVSRRGFIGGAITLAGALPFATHAAAMGAAGADTAPGIVAMSGYRSLGASDAAFVEAMVNALCQADALTPDGVTSGLAAFVDAYLAGEVDTAALGHRELFMAGMSAADASCRRRFGRAFHELPAADARQFLRDIRAGRVEAEFPLASWSSDVVEPVLKQACFSGHVYETYEGRMFWKLFA